MTRRNRILTTVAVILLFAILPMTVTTSSATPASPPSKRYGQPVSDTKIPKDIGVIIEEQNITFDLPEFPKLNSEDMLDGSIPGSVRIDYSLYNPTEKEISFDISYPFGKASGSFEYYDHIETDKYSILVNGEPVDTAARYGLDLHYNNYHNNDNDLNAIISDEYISGEYCSPDMTVTKYTFEQGDVNEKLYHCVAFDINPKDMNGACVYLDGVDRIDRQKDGDYRISIQTKGKGSTYDLYVFGGDLTETPEWFMYLYGNTTDGNEEKGNIKLINTETITFAEFASSQNDGSLGINELDWYNIIATELSSKAEDNVKAFDFNCFEEEADNFIFGGLSYGITLAPGEHTVVTVNAPVYPTIETANNPYTYTYSYIRLQNNAWLLTGNINVNIITPYYIVEYEGSQYHKTEDGYSLTINSEYNLSNLIYRTSRESSFTLCEVDKPKGDSLDPQDFLIIPIFFAILFAIIYPVWLVYEAIQFIIQKVSSWDFSLFASK